MRFAYRLSLLHNATRKKQKQKNRGSLVTRGSCLVGSLGRATASEDYSDERALRFNTAKGNPTTVSVPRVLCLVLSF